MIRLAGAALLTGAGLCIGLVRSGKLKRRVETLAALIRLMEWMKNRLRYSAAPLSDLMRQAAEETGFFPLRIPACPEGRPFSLCWDALIDGTELPASDRQLLRRFGSEMGRTDLKGQLAHMEMYAAQTEQLRRIAAEEYEKKGRVPTALWTAGAAVLALLLL